MLMNITIPQQALKKNPHLGTTEGSSGSIFVLFIIELRRL
jgi:hypothetical protein